MTPQQGLDAIARLIRDDHLIEVMGTEYLSVPTVRTILDLVQPGPDVAQIKRDTAKAVLDRIQALPSTPLNETVLAQIRREYGVES